jgi:hypothetical protein
VCCDTLKSFDASDGGRLSWRPLSFRLVPFHQKAAGRAEILNRKNKAPKLSEFLGFHVDPAARDAIERFAAAEPDLPTVSEALRRLVELGLKAKK